MKNSPMIHNCLHSFCCVAFFSMLVLSCSNGQNKNELVLEELEESLATSNKYINRNTEFVYSYIQEAASDPTTHVKAEIWLPKAKLAQRYTSEITRYIDSIKETFKRGYFSDNPYDIENVRKFFIIESNGKDLYKRLTLYKANMLDISPLIVRDIGVLNVFNKKIDSTTNKEDAFLDTYFAFTAQIEALALLTNFQYKAKSFEYRTVLLFSEQWTRHFVEDYLMYSAIVAQSSKYAKPGDELEIIAGLGSFNVEALPTITIDGNKIALGAEGAAHYKFKAATKKGKHIIPTLIEFIDREGKKVQITKEVEYFVNKE